MSDIDGLLPLIALVVAAIAMFAGGERAPSGPPKRTVKFTILGVGVLLLVGLWFFQRSANQTWADIAGAKAGVILGILGATCAEWCAQWGKPSKVLPIAFAAFDLSIAPFFGHFAPLAYVFGAAATAWVLSIKTEARFAARTAIVSGGIVACDMLGADQATPVNHVGVFLALAAAVAGLLALPIGEGLAKKDKKLSPATPLVLFVVFAAAAFLVFRKLGLVEAFTAVFFGASIVALVVAWLAQEEESLTRVVIGSILWLAVASASYGYLRGFGMSVALIAGLGITLVLDRPKALLCLGPLAAVVVFRVFSQLHPEAGRSFDIGQHYQLMGLLLGVLVPILAGEWLRSAPPSKLLWLAAVLWLLVMAAAPLPVAIAFSDKGIIGYLVGLGLAPVLEATRRRSLDTLFISIGLGCSMVLLYNWIQPHLELDRHEKIVALSWVVGLIAVAVIGILAISRPRPEQEAV